MPFINLYVVKMNMLGLFKPSQAKPIQSEPTKVKHAQSHIIFDQSESVIGVSNVILHKRKFSAANRKRKKRVRVVIWSRGPCSLFFPFIFN